MLAELSYLSLKDSYNIIVARDEDILALEENINYSEYKVVRMLSR